MERRVREAFHIYKRQPKINRDSGLERSAVWNAVLWELALPTCSSEFVLNSWYPIFFSFFLSVSLSLCLSLYLSLSLSLSIVMFEFEPLYKKRKKRKRNKGRERKNHLFIYLFIYFYFYFIFIFIFILFYFIYFFGSVWRHFWPACAYTWTCMVRSGLLLLTRSRWNAVGCYGIQFVFSVSQSPTSRCGLPSK